MVILQRKYTRLSLSKKMHLLTSGRDQGDGYSSEKIHKLIMIKENATPHRW
jgi:hypothetical protein